MSFLGSIIGNGVNANVKVNFIIYLFDGYSIALAKEAGKITSPPWQFC